MITSISYSENSFIQGIYLPREIFTKIFLDLDFSSLKCFPSVCQAWKSITHHPSFQYQEALIAKKHGQAALKQLKLCIQNQLLTLEQAFKYAPLIGFLNPRDFIRQVKETESHNPYFLQFQMHAQKPIYQNDWRQCVFTENQSTVLLIDQEDQNCTVLTAPNENQGDLVRVCANADFVFALSSNGKIIQWDPNTQSQIQMIETSLCHLDLKKVIPTTILHMQDEYLILTYRDEQRAENQIITEFISFSTSGEASFKIELPILTNVVKVDENQIYLITSLGQLMIFNKKNNKIQDPERISTCMHVSKENIFLFDNARSIDVFEKSLKRHSKLNYISSLKRPLLEGVLTGMRLFDHKEFLICCSTVAETNAQHSSHYITIWYVKSTECIYHSKFDGSYQEIISSLESESGKRKQKFWNVTNKVKENCIIN